MKLDKYQLRVILILFFLSGATGLIYELVWIRMLSLVFGNTTYAVSIVLSAFMAGLAVGSWFFGRLTDRITDTKHRTLNAELRIYGLLMLAIGFYSLSTPLLFELVKYMNINLPIERYILNPASGTKIYYLSPVLYVLTFIFSFIVILIPTALMGGTFPVLVKHFTFYKDEIGVNAGVLYSVNTWGAVLGTFLCGYFLIMRLGIKETLYLAAVTNIIVAGVVFVLVKNAKEEIAALPLVTRNDRWGVSDTLKIKSVLIAIGVSGFTALSYEVLWTRVLTMILGSSTYALTTMLCSFLIGIALGSWFYTKVSRLIAKSLNHSIANFGFIQGGVGVSVLLLIPIFDILPVVFLKFFHMIGNVFVGVQFIQFMIAFIVMLVPTTLFGMTIPLACKIYSGNVVRLFRVANSEAKASHYNVGIFVGNVYAANTVGAILGSLTAGFLLIPLVGLQKAITIVALINISLAIIFLLFNELFGGSHKTATARVLRYGTVLFLIFFTVPYVLALPQWNKNILSSGSYIYAKHYERLKGIDLRKHFEQFNEMLFYKEGHHFSVAVIKDKNSGSLRLKIDGKTDASTNLIDMTTQLLSAHIPLMLHPKPDDVLVIGLASGITLSQVGRYPVKTIDCVEIEPSMIKANEYFKDFNNDILKDKRVKVFLEDGRNYLLGTEKKYSTIISEPTNVWISGSSQLFTKEYFQLCYNRLKDGGIVAQWLQIYQLPLEDVKSVLKTFFEVFDYGNVWFTSHGGDLLLIGSNTPIKISNLTDRFHFIKENLKKIKMDEIEIFLVRFLMNRDKALAISYGSKPNTDNNPYVEFSAPKGLYEQRIFKENYDFLLSQGDVISEESGFSKDRLIDVYIKAGLYNQAEKLIKIEIEKGKKANLYNALGYISLLRNNQVDAEKQFFQALSLKPDYKPVLGNLSQLYLKKGDTEKAIIFSKKLIQLYPYSGDAWNNLGMVYLNQGNTVEAEKMFKKSIEVERNFALGYFNLGSFYIYKRNDVQKGLEFLIYATEIQPENIDFKIELANLYKLLGQTKKMLEIYNQIAQIDPYYFFWKS